MQNFACRSSAYIFVKCKESRVIKFFIMTSAIIFDLDDTLIEDYHATQKAFVTTCQYAHEQCGLDAERLAEGAYRQAHQIWSIAAIFAYCNFIGISASECLWGDFVDGSGCDSQLRALHDWVPTYRREAWSRALAEQGVQDVELAEKLGERFRIERRTASQVFPEVEPLLKELRQNKKKLGMLTNGAPDLQREKIKRAGLERYFDAIVISGEVGVGKPDPEVFSHLLERLDARPQETTMVGDSLPCDIIGAHRSGIRAVWVNRLGRACTQQHGPMIHARITDLSEIANIAW